MDGIFSYKFPLASPEKAETSTTSSDGDEEVVLAASKPKKRAGRRVFKETRHPVYRGVRRRNGDKWVCELREPVKKARIWLGTYPTPEMAARAHDVAVLAFRGKSACLNFADSAWKLPVPASTSAVDVRKAASEAAEMFRPRESIELVHRSNDFTNDHNGEVSIYNSEMNNISGESSAPAPEFIDEEAIFDMPGLLVDMAGGLMLSPPRCNDLTWDAAAEAETEVDWSLWNY